jgi:putative transcriptional regulator
MSKARLSELKRRLKSVEDFSHGRLQLQPHKVKVRVPEVKKIRENADLTQQHFADLFGWSVDTVRSWETGRRIPDQSARILLWIFSKEEKLVLDVLEEDHHLVAAE